MRRGFAHIARRGQAFAKGSRPRVYCEAWPNPRISSPRWVAEIVKLAGGRSVVQAGKRVTDAEIAVGKPDVIVLAWAATGDRAKREQALRQSPVAEHPGREERSGAGDSRRITQHARTTSAGRSARHFARVPPIPKLRDSTGSTMMLTVVAAFIEHDGKLLVCQRRRGDRFELMWEFRAERSIPAKLRRKPWRVSYERSSRLRHGSERRYTARAITTPKCTSPLSPSSSARE